VYDLTSHLHKIGHFGEDCFRATNRKYITHRITNPNTNTIEGGPPANACIQLMLIYPVYCSCDLDLDPMISADTPDPDILKMYLLTDNEVSGSRLPNITAQTGKKTDSTQTQ